MIRELDLVWLTHCHDWAGRVMRIECDQAMVVRPDFGGEVAWMLMQFLELTPGQEEDFWA